MKNILCPFFKDFALLGAEVGKVSRLFFSGVLVLTFVLVLAVSSYADFSNWTAYDRNWNAHDQSDWAINGSLVQQTNLDHSEFMFIDGNNTYTDFTFSVDMRFDDTRGGDGPFAGIVFRGQESGSFYTVWLREYYNDIEVVAYDGISGPVQYNHSSSFDIVMDQWYELKTTVQGSNVKIWVDGDLKMDFTDTQYLPSSGNIGLITNASTASFNNISVVPEPISSTLFIVGGATLGLRRFRKKFKK